MGFAVVADEVKNLANRSADNVKETSKMIKEIMVKIDNGLDISKKMAEVFKDILTNSKKVSEMSKEVESASRQQDEGISQINKAIMQLDSVVQNNAATSEQTASAAEELLSQVDNLNEIVKDLFSIITGKEFTIRNKSTNPKAPAQIKNNYSEKTAYSEKKTKLLTDTIEKKENPAEKRKERKISFEDDEEFKDMDSF
jgi:methyl-accepting chemotaxis protein